MTAAILVQLFRSIFDMSSYGAQEVANALSEYPRLKQVAWIGCSFNFFSVKIVPVPHLDFFLAPSPRIHKVGLSLVVDHSGKVFKRKGSAAVSLKDVAINKEVAQLETIVFPTIMFFGVERAGFSFASGSCGHFESKWRQGALLQTFAR